MTRTQGRNLGGGDAHHGSGYGYGELDLLRVYLDELGCHPLLDRAGEARVAQALEDGKSAQEALEHDPDLSASRRRELEGAVASGRRARAEFTNANLRLVVSVARRYQNRGVDLGDLIQEGNLGLMRAIERFDWRRDFKFSTYATWWIRKSVVQAVSDSSSTVRLPRHRRDQARLLVEAAEQLERETGHLPGTAELARATGMRQAEVSSVRRASARIVSLSSPVDEDGNELVDLVADPYADVATAAERTVLPDEVARLLEGLPESSATLLRMRYGLDGAGPARTVAEVAAALSISPERVRQIEGRAIARLRQRLPRDLAS